MTTRERIEQAVNDAFFAGARHHAMSHAAAREVLHVVKEDLQERYNNCLSEDDDVWSAAIGVINKRLAELSDSAPSATEATTGWQPIESAPKDCGWVQLSDGKMSGFGHRHYVGDWWNCYPSGFGTPTLWAPLLPLPAPPKSLPSDTEGHRP